MTTPQTTVPTSKTTRILHGAMVTGVLLFAIVAHFVLRPASVDAEGLTPATVSVLLALSLGACALSLLLRTRVPKRLTDESADVFWRGASQPAMLVWAALEGASLLAVFVYARTRSIASVVMAAVAIVLLVVVNPGYFERR